MIHLVIGGARSGKSSFAEQLVQEIVAKENKTPVYVATGVAVDEEMTDRISRHQLQRAQASHSMNVPWHLIESPLHIAKECQAFEEHHVVLIDCLSLWLNNHLQNIMGNEVDDDDVDNYLISEKEKLVNAIAGMRCDLIVVSNEVGLGVVPLGKETRWFVDHLGWLNQAIANAADNVTSMIAGLPLSLKRSNSE